MEYSAAYIFSALKKSTLFKGLSTAKIKALMPHLNVQRYDANEIIIHEGETSSEVFLIVEGEVEIIKDAHTQKESYTIAELNALDYFGEMSILGESLRSATVRTKTPTTVIAISVKKLLVPKYGRDTVYGVIMHNMSLQLADRLSNTNEVAVSALQREISLVKKMAAKSLKESREQLRVITDALPVLIAYIDLEHKYQLVNKAYEEWFEGKRQDFLGHSVQEIIGDKAYAQFADYLKKCAQGYEVSEEMVIPFGVHQKRYVNVVLIPHEADDEIKGFFSLMHDITQQKQAQERLNYLASHDFLTKLPNRVLFYKKLNQAISYASKNNKTFAMMYLDLDHFKEVNDNLGHDIGDKLLVEVVKRLRTCVRSSDMVARIGGDEFIILLENLKDIQRLGELAGNICMNLAQPFIINDHEIMVSTSVGIGIYPQDGRDAAQLIKNTDVAMYNAKIKGRNCYQFASEKKDR
jgi:diguanylate cyclase (GGDEF)-like protein/PAS domain S-box-containing protein